MAPELADELRLLAGWLELERVAVARKGDLAAELAKAVAASAGAVSINSGLETERASSPSA